jgi:hypothetical protein
MLEKADRHDLQSRISLADAKLPRWSVLLPYPERSLTPVPVDVGEIVKEIVTPVL